MQQDGKQEDVDEQGQKDYQEKLEDIADKYEELKTKVEQYFDDSSGQVKKRVPIVKVPDKPTKDVWLRHQATHTPYAAWCRHCVAARMVRHQHPSKGRRKIFVKDTESLDGQPTTISIDYMYLHERTSQNKEGTCNPPQLIMIDHKSGRVWSYRVPYKGILEGASWLPKRIVQDLDNCGYGEVQLQFKSDQEPAIVMLQTAVQDLRPNSTPTNSPVGESESNGSVENAIRRVLEQVRVIRHQFECGIKAKIPDDAPMMAWLIRWAGELISK